MKNQNGITVIEAEVLHNMALKLITRCHTKNAKDYSPTVNGILIDLTQRANNYLAIAQGRKISPHYNRDPFDVELGILTDYDNTLTKAEKELAGPRFAIEDWDASDDLDSNAANRTELITIAILGVVAIVWYFAF